MKEGEALTSKAKTNPLIVSLSKTWNEGRRYAGKELRKANVPVVLVKWNISGKFYPHKE